MQTPKIPPHTQQTPIDTAVRQANKASDYWVLALSVGICLAISLFALFTSFLSALYADSLGETTEEGVSPVDDFFGSTFGILFLVAAGLILILTLTRMMRQTYLGNALQVEYSDYAWLRDWSNKVAADLHMPRVEIMVTQDPVMNAFAFGFAKPYTIVLNSGSVRWLTDEQLKVVVVHEMAHVKYHHTQISTYLSIFESVPLLGTAFTWILGFWSRRSELTADRLALCYLKDTELVKTSLIGIHVGPDVAKSFNGVARQWQEYVTNSTFNRFSQTFSSHPFLVRRLQHLDLVAARLLAPVPVVSEPQPTDKKG